MSNTNLTIQFSQEELNNEEWRPVVGWEGIYSVSNLGRIRRDLPAKKTYPGKILKQRINHGGYFEIQLFNAPFVKRKFVHRLVAEVFIGPRPKGFFVNHIDGCKTNNIPANLEYVTSKQNSQHASRLGLLAFGDRNGTRRNSEHLARGDRHWSKIHPDSIKKGDQVASAKLKDDDIPQIRELGKNGLSSNSIAKLLGVSGRTIRYIIEGITWKHVQ